MKPFLPIILGLMYATLTYSQNVSYRKDTNEDLVYILNNIVKTTEYSDSSNISIIVYSVADPSSSAGYASCEVTNTLYIAVSGYGEAPDQSLFKLSSVYDPKFIKWIKTNDAPELVIAYGPSDKRKQVKIKISLDKLAISQ